MKFGIAQAEKFKTSNGTYSIVTERENYDSQITLTDFEADLLISYFGKENIHIGNVHSNPAIARKPFRLFPDGKNIELNVVFPKPEKTELRLYISTRAGYKPKSNDVWFMFTKNGELWIGSQNEKAWRADVAILRNDEYEELYQEAIREKDEIKINRIKERDVFARDRKIALSRMKLSGYTCEFNNAHGLFISRYSFKPYLEAHHLIPMGLQKDFTKSLDTVHNVFCLCPYCHRAVHHAEDSVVRNIISTLVEKRPSLRAYALDINDILGLYAVETIV